MDVLSGALSKASTQSRIDDDFAITISLGQRSQGLRRADEKTLGVGITTLRDEHGAGRSKASPESRLHLHCLEGSREKFCADTASRAAQTAR